MKPQTHKSKILVVDDDHQVQIAIAGMLRDEGHRVENIRSATELRERLKGEAPELTLLDLKLPDGDGMQLIHEVHTAWPQSEIIMMTGDGTIERAVEAVKRGAFHFVAKPFERETVMITVARTIEHVMLKRQNQNLHATLEGIRGKNKPIFKSPQMLEVLETARRLASVEANVLITGESGAGKEVIADLLHNLSESSNGPMVKVNCAALPKDLIESELFGSQKGAYTGATETRAGLFAQAKDGTILLDEISEMPLETQSKLLRVIQDRQYRPLGSNRAIPVQCRIICCTNQSPKKAIGERKLRPDLYYRISTLRLHIPPLRDRQEDIGELTERFLERFASQARVAKPKLAAETLDCLQNYQWPGNVRELENVIQRAVLLCKNGIIKPGDIELEGDYCDRNNVDEERIIEAIQTCFGNKTEAAKKLGMSRQNLYRRIGMSRQLSEMFPSDPA